MSIEDPFDQDDWEGYVHLTERVGAGTQVMGDDLLVTNPTRIQTGIDKVACNALLLKVNQIGTLTESIKGGILILFRFYKKIFYFFLIIFKNSAEKRVK